MSEIKINVKINALVEKVYEALTKEEHVKKWWTPDTSLDSEKGRFEFNPHEDYVVVNVEKSEPNNVVEWKVTDSKMMGTNEWLNTKVIFELSEENGKTNRNFVHEGWKEETKCFESCTGGWNHFMNSLKSYLETGQGNPFSGK